MKDVHGLQSFVLTQSEESDSVFFIFCLQWQMRLASAFSKEISAISVEEWVLVFKVFTTATRRVKIPVYVISPPPSCHSVHETTSLA